ncbi:MAG: hypothetical protein V1847_03570 [Candidatus Diapherotrites archaeon]
MPIKKKHPTHVARKKSNRWLYEMAMAWIVLVIVGGLVNLVVLSPTVQDAGLLRAQAKMTSAIIAWIVVSGIVAYISISLLAWVEKKKRILLGFLMGIFFTVPQILEYFFYNVPADIMAWNLLGNLAAFGIIGWILSRKNT